MNKKYKDLLETYQDDIIRDIARLVKIKSVRDIENKKPGAPFGPGIRKAMDEFAAICTEIGLTATIDEDGYYAYAEIGPKDSEMIGIIGHLDTVPEGDIKQWTLADPFSGDVVDNQIVGRGTIDDKGPIILNLYAIKALLDLDIKLTKRIRVIVGGAEETTWEGIEKYISEQELPSISYSPDAEFPLIYAEKAIVRSDISGPGSSDFTIEAEGAYNAVNDHLKYQGPQQEELSTILNDQGLTTEIKDGCLFVYGKSAHSMESFKGINALLNLSQALYGLNIHHPLTDFLATQITSDVTNTIVFGEVSDEISGVLTTNIGLGHVNKDSSHFGIDLRIPVLVEPQDIVDTLTKAVSKANLTYKNSKTTDKLYVDRDSKLVKSLMQAYKDVTKDNKLEPLAIGGGTYARAFDNCVAFGPMFIDRDMKADIHQPNEAYEIKFMQPAIEIYIEGLKNLLK